MTRTSLRVMTYNTHHSTGNDDCITPPSENGIPPNPDCGLDIDRLASVVRGESPDVVALQEVDRFWARSGYEDQPAEFSRLLDMQVAFGANLDREANQHSDRANQFGVATLSPHPIVYQRNTLLPNVEDWEQRGLLATHINVEGVGEIAVFNTHLQVSLDGRQKEAAQQRRDQLEVIAGQVASLDLPTIVMGDFNTPPEDGELHGLVGPDKLLADAWTVRGDGPGNSIFFANFPAYARIDYILVSRHFTVDAIQVIDNDVTRMASDHLPVVADLSIAPQNRK